MFACRCVEENGPAAVLVTNRSAGVAPEVKLKEHVTLMPLSSRNKAAVSVAPQKDFFLNHLDLLLI